MGPGQQPHSYDAVVLGVSAGGMAALSALLGALPSGFSLPIVIVQHRSADCDDYLERHLARLCKVPVKSVDDKGAMADGVVYVAPPDYHVLIEADRTFALSVDPPVNFTRPAIDVLFESAADVFGGRLIGIILTGANSDGSYGLKRIADAGGMTVVQDPDTAESPAMPLAALAACKADRVAGLEEIGALLTQLASVRGLELRGDA